MLRKEGRPRYEISYTEGENRTGWNAQAKALLRRQLLLHQLKAHPPLITYAKQQARCAPHKLFHQGRVCMVQCPHALLEVLEAR